MSSLNPQMFIQLPHQNQTGIEGDLVIPGKSSFTEGFEGELKGLLCCFESKRFAKAGLLSKPHEYWHALDYKYFS
jgi:hypothetical protein